MPERLRAALMRPSRLAGLAVLAVMILIQSWAAVADRGILREGWWDLLQQTFPRARDSMPAVVVAIDTTAMAEVGAWPWQRNKIAGLIEQITDAGALAIGIDILFLDPDGKSPVVYAEQFRDLDPRLADAISAYGDSDAALADALRFGNAVLPAVGVEEAPTRDGNSLKHSSPIVFEDGVDANLIRKFAYGTGMIDSLQPFAVGYGAISLPQNNELVVRDVYAVQMISDRPYAMLGPETLRVGTEAFETRIAPAGSGLAARLGEYDMLFERDGRFWIHFGRVDPARYISASDLLHPEVDNSVLDGKLVFLAATQVGTVDERRTPLGETVYGVEMHLQMVEQIVDGRFLRRPVQLFWLESALMIAASLFVILMMPLARPQRSVALVVIGVVLTLGVAVALFFAGLLIDPATPLLETMAVTATVLAATLIERDRDRLNARIDLAAERADRAQLQGELSAAARIQQSLLPPDTFRRNRVDLACHIEPARTVGGDFYDHFMIDDQRLFFLIADVSGKGADASQFMVLSKSLWKSVALRSEGDLGTIQVSANREITRENAETMFVTALCGLIDLERMQLSYSCAGHDAPILFAAGKAPRQLAPRSGPPIGLLDSAEFPVGVVDLQPGDRLCIFTDGVSEAMNVHRERFGIRHLHEVLANAPEDATSPELVRHIVSHVRRFTQGAEQSDDLTLMVVRIPKSTAPQA